MRLHVPSLLVGAALVTLVGLLSAQQLVNAPQVDVRIVEPRLDDHARNAVRIVEGVPLTVPAGKLLVVTALGANRYTSVSARLYVNSSRVVARELWPGGPQGPYDGPAVSLQELPRPGVIATAGDMVDVQDDDQNTNDARAWGYFIDQ